MSAFEELGVAPELIRAVEELGWELPTDCQAEAVPLILTGGDVLCAAETGSGKTGAFALPILQEVFEAATEEGMPKEAEPEALKGKQVRMSMADRDTLLAVDEWGSVCQARSERSWAGGRATVGVKEGSFYFEARVRDEGLVRVGWSTKVGSLELGTDKQSFGFGGTGKKSHAKQFDDYGEPFGLNDIIGCCFDGPSLQISYVKNGNSFGPAHSLPEMLKGKALYPAICLKNAEVQLNFGGPFHSIPDGFRPVADAKAKEAAVEGADTTVQSGKRLPKSVILEPARDLAEQTHECITSFKKYLDNPAVRNTLLVGGLDASKQEKELRQGTDIVTGTPGRIIDMLDSGKLDVSGVRFFVLDEADRLLDTGNFDAIMKIFNRLPKAGIGNKRLQVLMFSATLHSSEVQDLVHKICAHPTWVDLKGKDAVPETVHHVKVTVDPKQEDWSQLSPNPPTDNVHVFDSIQPGKSLSPESCSQGVKALKPHALRRLIDRHSMDQCLIFCRTNFDCDNLEKFLNGLGGGKKFTGPLESGKENPYSCAVLGGARKQEERRQNLEAFKNGHVRFLICTDVAARGIDVHELPFVINFTLPDKAEDYIHRSGRVGRSDHWGLAISLVAAEPEKVWFCQKPGYKPWFNPTANDVRLNEEGGHTMWYDEPRYLRDIEARLGQSIASLKEDMALPDELAVGGDASLYGQSRSGSYSATISQHLSQLEPHVRAVADLEGQAQASFWHLRTHPPVCF